MCIYYAQLRLEFKVCNYKRPVQSVIGIRVRHVIVAALSLLVCWTLSMDKDIDSDEDEDESEEWRVWIFFWFWDLGIFYFNLKRVWSA
ncbi:hypothetical protein GALMADRAFT_1243524 [Galerina marginata CBS 339.88]|uniref:Uncharacterized protein n=1 Tax=Galerina marginata (strain CBS 339.88) TaxID=685588 RepID=A0A067T8R6_GALM3|nr:hypothetical protein GALMADRAFT_1243524 [Galerina marginata CBS 339.88]